MSVSFFTNQNNVILVEHEKQFSKEEIDRLNWLLEATYQKANPATGTYTGARKEMVTPWSTNAVEITQNAGINGITRIEQFTASKDSKPNYDPMLQQVYAELNEDTLKINHTPEPVEYIDDIAAYNQSSGLAMSPDEIEYLEEAVEKMGRKFTDSELFGFAQANSEHCRHKIFNGEFIIDGKTQDASLFKLIKETSKQHHNDIISAYKDNCAFVDGYSIDEFKPEQADTPSNFNFKGIDSVISLKAETHNFPTTVEPFMGAATGSGGEIRDRMAGGQGSLPLAGTACYMTPYPRLGNHEWEKKVEPRNWLYQTPQQILTKASNGASDYGNKFGQPLTCGSVLTFEHNENGETCSYDKTIMLAGGIGYANKKYALKHTPNKGDKVVILGGDNYRIGMGGGAVSSVNTGEYDRSLELNAVQRANPEMQKRAQNAIRGIVESTNNPIVTIHDHGAGGHVNALSELLEETGGVIYLDKLPIGDKTLSDKEIIGNESQERMGLIVNKDDIELVHRICDRERCPFYVVGEITNDQKIRFVNKDNKAVIDLDVQFIFGKPPKTVIDAKTNQQKYNDITSKTDEFSKDIENLLQLEAVGCKDWLTNKVDRSVTGRVAQQQNVGPLHLPLADYAVSTLDFTSKKGIATSMGHQSVAGLLDPIAGSILSIAESLTNVVFAPLKNGLASISLSANWMWPCKCEGEDARLYSAVEAASKFALELGINIPTGKDSMSMTQSYDNKTVKAPGTVIISTVAACKDITKCVTPDLKEVNSKLVYVNLSGQQENNLGGSSFAQIKGALGITPPTVTNAKEFKNAFNTIQKLINDGKILAGHDVSNGGLITTVLEMAFTGNCGISLDVKELDTNFLFCEKPGVVLQVTESDVDYIVSTLKNSTVIGSPNLNSDYVFIGAKDLKCEKSISALRKLWFKPSYQLEKFQVPEDIATERYNNFDKYPLTYKFPANWNGSADNNQAELLRTAKGTVNAAIIREKGTNGEREMAYSLHAAGFNVKDVMMTDLMSGRETLDDIQFIVFCGGFSNSDVLGSAKGWAASFMYNETAKNTLEAFYKRKDTMSLGVCNGCQLMVWLNELVPEHDVIPEMHHNNSHKFESSFVQVSIPETTNAIMFEDIKGTDLGIWVAHGEGKFHLPKAESEYDIAMKYSHSEYPVNPNGSSYDAAGIVSKDGRHLAMMPHLERAILPWQWPYYPAEHKHEEVTPWIKAFVSAKKWFENK